MRAIKLLALFILVGAGIVAFWAYAYQRSCLPKINGRLEISGLSDDVEIIRDEWGVPHIMAKNKKDLFTAVGYVMAQDRLFQMDFMRRVARGQLAEILGPDYADTDHFLRLLVSKWPESRVDATLSGKYREAMVAFADGVNAFLKGNNGSLPWEFKILGYAPEPWKHTDGVYVNLLMGWDLQTGYMDLTLWELANKVGLEMAESAIPGYPGDARTIIPSGQYNTALLAKTLYPLDTLENSIPFFAPGADASNGWAVSGTRTASGKPILCQDPHLGLTTPSIWYEMHIQAEDIDTTGVTFTGMPVMVIGNNRHIAWGCTNVMLDDMDFYFEKINPANPNQYWYDGQWQDMEVLTESIAVKDADPVTRTIRLTVHGPVINDVRPGMTKVLSMRWTLNDGLGGSECFYDLNSAKNWDDFRAAVGKFHGPAQNMPYADVDGNIGYYTAGRIPIRANPGEGALPMPGWDGLHEWQGYLPFSQNPHLFNPESGYVVVANNRTAGDEFPHYISRYFVAKYRAERIADVIESKEKITVSDMVALQNDLYSLEAEEITPIILEAFKDQSPTEPMVAAALEYLKKWDFQTGVDSVGASIYHAIQQKLLTNMYLDQMGPELFKKYMGSTDSVLKGFAKIMADSESPWFDDAGTPDRQETRSDIIQKSTAEAVADLKESLGDDMDQWTWGRLHQHVSGHLIFKDIKVLGRLFNIGPIPIGGSKATVAPAAYQYKEPYKSGHGASTRQIVDFSDPKNNIRVITSGCSGQIGSKYYDNQNELWREGKYHPILMDRADIEKHAAGRLVLSPTLDTAVAPTEPVKAGVLQ
jgi:penicillin amidase